MTESTDMEGEDQPVQTGEYRKGSDAYLIDVIEQGFQNLLNEMQQGKSDRLLAYLAFSSRFHRYSLSNQMLIYMQCPRATRVAGYKTWQQLGYQVARGQKGIRILAPHTYVRKDDITGKEEQAIYFVSVPVFDASQLANSQDHPLPEFWTPLEDDQTGLVTRLEQVIRDDGIKLSESEDLGDAQGLCLPAELVVEIVVKKGLDSRSKFLVLVHEYAHDLLHWDEQGRRQTTKIKECHAEAISFIVASYFGIHNPFSSDYLQDWGNTPTDLFDEMNVVKRTAARIIGKLKTPLVIPEGGD